MFEDKDKLIEEIRVDIQKLRKLNKNRKELITELNIGIREQIKRNKILDNIYVEKIKIYEKRLLVLTRGY